MSREWTEEAESYGSIIRSYCNPRLLFCTIGDVCLPQEAFYDPRVGVNIMSRALADYISLEQPLTLSRKHLKWIDGQIVESRGILRVVPFMMETNKVYLDFHIFDISEGVEFLLVCSCNIIAEARPEQDQFEEAVCTIQDGQTQPFLDDIATHFTRESESDGHSKLDGEEPPQPSLPELKPLPPGLKFAFLHNNRATPVVISDKLTESETQRLVAALEKYRSISGYTLQDMKGISPNLCTHHIPMELDHKTSREHQWRLNDAMREVVKKEV